MDNSSIFFYPAAVSISFEPFFSAGSSPRKIILPSVLVSAFWAYAAMSSLGLSYRVFSTYSYTELLVCGFWAGACWIVGCAGSTSFVSTGACLAGAGGADSVVLAGSFVDGAAALAWAAAASAFFCDAYFAADCADAAAFFSAAETVNQIHGEISCWVRRLNWLTLWCGCLFCSSLWWHFRLIDYADADLIL